MTNLPTKFDIDLSARFYPIIATKKSQSMFRVGATLVDEVDRATLERALNDTIGRFPQYKVRLKKGYAWHYFETNDEPIKVFDMPSAMLRPIDEKETNGYLFRVCVEGRDIILEIFHALTDGNGAIAFLKTFIFRYRQLQGVNVCLQDGIYDIKEKPTDEEMQDSFIPNYKPLGMDFKTLAGSVPHKIEGTLKAGPFARNIVSAKAQDILAKAKELGVSYTAYTVALLAKSIMQISSPQKPIVLMVPINLRNIYNSKTLRNFVTFVRIVIQPNSKFALQEYAKEVATQIKDKSSKDRMDEFISTTVKAQRNVVLKIVPLCVKAFFIKVGRLFMKSRQTIICSNLGVHNLPKELGVERLIFNLNVSKNNTQNVGIITTNGVSTISITSCIKEKALPQTYFNEFVSQGVAINQIEG